ncbi:ribosomal protein L1 [Coniochaeta ligniaria NRRL 30616]|uniref:Ribosomal protein L1 n=1 Tax=Coniochaeta ligniaria NRRL 30616 TaxID=1408157 RepID=A0A1J7JKM6_9PEZI|nr:ribosomal protein L1 [Coniochaeta ligniaria NRRL 30616]
MAKTTTVAKASDASGSLVDPEQILKASKALLAHIKKAANSQDDSAKKNLLADPEEPQADTPIWLTLTTKRHIKDSSRLQPAKIPLPHSLNADPESTICIITADPQRAYKNIVASEEFPDELRKQITRVIDITHLKAKFKAYEAQRKLFNDHEIFLADDRIINQLPKILGKTFFKSTAKRPVPVVLMVSRERVDGKRVARPRGKKEKRDPSENVNARPLPEIVAEIQKAIGAALVHLSPSTNTAVKVGYAGWTAEHLAANIETVAAALVDRFVPQKWDNVRSLYIKGPETAALPLWQTGELWVDDAHVVADGEDAPKAIDDAKSERPNIGKKRKSLEADAEDEQVDEPKKTRAAKKAKVPESNDDKLDKEIAERKERLKKQKKAAKKAIDA